jgi:hypothetical protein
MISYVRDLLSIVILMRFLTHRSIVLYENIDTHQTIVLVLTGSFYHTLLLSPTYWRTIKTLTMMSWWRLRRRWIRARTKRFVILYIRYTFMNRNSKRKSVSIMSTYIYRWKEKNRLYMMAELNIKSNRSIIQYIYNMSNNLRQSFVFLFIHFFL